MKYIIDVPDTQEITYYTEQKMVCLKVNEGIVASEIYIDAEPYTEPDRKAIENEVWGFVKKIECLTIGETEDCFDVEYEGIPFVANVFSFQEAKDKYEKWLKQKEEIKVGDEIVGIYSDGEKTSPLVVLKVEGNYYYGIYSKTGEFTQGGLNYEKTGRHFPEVAELLEKMRGEEE